MTRFFGQEFSEEDDRLFARVRAWRRDSTNFSALNAERLTKITQGEGVEFATALFFDCAVRAPATAALLEATKRADVAAMERPDLVAVVPGAFYREHRDTGADGQRVLEIARQIGCAGAVIPVEGFGRIADNARVIREWLHARQENKIVLVSLSKGGSDVKAALAAPNARETFGRVQAWISFSGIVEGTPLIGWLRTRWLRWWGVKFLLLLRRHPSGTLDDLDQREGAPLASWPELPEQMATVHICGVPLRRHLQHRWAPKAYDRLSPIGPNDGGAILLGDLCGTPGTIYPIWGADHYLQPSWNATPLLRDIVIATLTPAPRHANQSATAPTTAPASRSIA